MFSTSQCYKKWWHSYCIFLNIKIARLSLDLNCSNAIPAGRLVFAEVIATYDDQWSIRRRLYLVGRWSWAVGNLHWLWLWLCNTLAPSPDHTRLTSRWQHLWLFREFWRLWPPLPSPQPSFLQNRLRFGFCYSVRFCKSAPSGSHFYPPRSFWLLHSRPPPLFFKPGHPPWRLFPACCLFFNSLTYPTYPNSWRFGKASSHMYTNFTFACNPLRSHASKFTFSLAFQRIVNTGVRRSDTSEALRSHVTTNVLGSEKWSIGRERMPFISGGDSCGLALINDPYNLLAVEWTNGWPITAPQLEEFMDYSPAEQSMTSSVRF